MTKVILVINAGSSSIKFSVFSYHIAGLNIIYHGEVDIRNNYSDFNVYNEMREPVSNKIINATEYSILFSNIFNWLDELSQKYTLVAVGHRVVHGGSYFTQPVFVTPEVIERMASLILLAPLHQEHNLNAIKIIARIHPTLTQIAVFDTTFHLTQPRLARLFAIPRNLTDAGVIRYGFHGISYEYIASVISDKIGDIGSKKVIVAHLGSGASMCAMYNRKSVATSMGFTALDGLMMGTRCGSIDPGAILYLIQQQHYSVDKMLRLLYQESGLLGVSGISNNMQELLGSENPTAFEAIELFCYRAALEFGSLSIALGGCDAIVFTAGIGEHVPQIRQKICVYLEYLGVRLDFSANTKNEVIISTQDSTIMVAVIPTNEEYMIASHVCSLII